MELTLRRYLSLSTAAGFDEKESEVAEEKSVSCGSDCCSLRQYHLQKGQQSRNGHSAVKWTVVVRDSVSSDSFCVEQSSEFDYSGSEGNCQIHHRQQPPNGLEEDNERCFHNDCLGVASHSHYCLLENSSTSLHELYYHHCHINNNQLGTRQWTSHLKSEQLQDSYNCTSLVDSSDENGTVTLRNFLYC